jgi:hypothetical protein
MQFTLRMWMAVIALCAVLLFLLRLGPPAVFVGVPFIGVSWDLMRGGKGFTGGLAGGAISSVTISVLITIDNWSNFGTIPFTYHAIVRLVWFLSIYTLGSGAVGLAAGNAVRSVRFLGKLPKNVRPPKDESAKANLWRPISQRRSRPNVRRSGAQ